VGGGRTTRCCSAVALIAASSLAIAAQSRCPSVATKLIARSRSADPPPLFPAGTLWTLALNQRLTIPPAYAESHAYFAIEGDQLAAYELGTGAQEWIVTARPQLEPATGEGLLFIVEPGLLKALRTTDGGTVWERPIPGDLVARPVWDNGWLILATREGEILALRAHDGYLIWRRDLGSQAHAPPSLAADRVYVTVDDGRLVALRVDTGALVWERRLGGPATGVLALDDHIYAGSIDNFFYSLNADDGKVDWRWRTGADLIGVPVVDERNVYFVSLDNVLRALGRNNGVQQWVRLLPLRPTRGPLRAGASLVVTGTAPTLRAYNIKDGTPAGDMATGGELAGAPYVVPDSPLPQLLFVTRDIAKGASATLIVHRIEPTPTPPAPLPNPVTLAPPTQSQH